MSSDPCYEFRHRRVGDEAVEMHYSGVGLCCPIAVPMVGCLLA